MSNRNAIKATNAKVEELKNILAGCWALDLQRAWRCGFDAGRNSINIVPVVKPKRKAKTKT